MTKADIIKNIAETSGIARKDVSVVVEAFMEEVRNSMIQKEEVFLRGFGSFILKHRAPKKARNITKGTTIELEARDLPAFKPAKSFFQKVNEN